MSYYKQVSELAKEIQDKAESIAGAEKHRHDWVRPKGATFWLGYHMNVTREDGTTPAQLQGIKREVLKAFDDIILTRKSELEGLRFKLVNLAKKGSAA